MKRKIILSLAFISLFLSFGFIGESYAKYISSVNNVATMSVARWRILVNNKDILEENQASQVITPVFYENEHISNSVIAPTSEGYFDLILDATNADVSFSYTITTSVNETSAVSDLKVTGYSLNDGEILEIANNEDITGEILYKNEKIHTIRIYLKWSDTDLDTMNNNDDTQARNKDAKLDVNLNFIQLAN